ncbi:MAG: sugar porter family MFS transporter [Kiritimatiellae bacterium]|nr:sugar porter family MFS transporter [Kiritimatiellia bacterium]MDD4735546.1 sugar porter family MFS transporter [Kiritimatiellia bacterium]
MSEPITRYKPIVYIVGLTAALAGLLFGLDVGVISGALQFIEKDLGIGTFGLEEVVSALLWGATFGALISGFFTKALGRKSTLLIGAVIFALGSLCCSIAPTAGILIGARFVLGIAVGIASFTAPMYLSEIAPRSIRGALVSMYQLLITIGIVLAFMSDTYFATYCRIHEVLGGHWRLMLGSLVVPSTLMFIAVFFLPESPRWLLLKGRSEHARRVLDRIRNSAEEVSRELEEIETSLEQKQNGFHLLRNNPGFRKVLLLGIGLQVIQQLTGINVVMYYAPKIFSIAGFQTSAEQMWGTVLVGCINVLATFVAIAFVDKLGRKPIMYGGFIVMGIAMTAVGLCFKFGLDNHPAVQSDSALHSVNPLLSFAAIAFILLFIIGFAASAGPIIWVMCAEIFPTAGRDLGITVSTCTNWVVNGIVGVTFLSLLEGFGHGNTFLLYGGIEILFILFFLRWAPETKGVSLEKIEANVLHGKKLREIGR